MNRTAPIALAALALVVAGCVNPVTQLDALGGQDPSQVLPYLELSDSHDHKNATQHNVSWNMELLGWNPIAPDVTKLGRYNHVNVHGTKAFVTAYMLENGTSPGLAVFNISGPAPVLTATLATPDLTPIDVHVSGDGKYVVIAGHRDNRFALPGPAQACTGTPLLNLCTPFVPGGVMLIDVSDESNPVLVDTYASAPSGAHTAKIVGSDGMYHVYIASYGFAYANRLASGVEILMVGESPLGVKMQPVARFLAKAPSGNDGGINTFVHDMWIEDHPVTNQTLMYVSYWDGGVVIADVSDPHRPTQVASWTDFDASLYGNIHFARPVGMIGERHITYAAPEFGSAEHAGEAYVLDTTDPTQPKLLTSWTIPGDPVNDQNYRFSPHNFDPKGTLLAYAHYHGGVWVLDIANPEEPVVKAYGFPTVPEGAGSFNATEDAPNVWAAVWADDGTLYASDIGTGLYHYRMVEDEPGTPPYVAALR